MTLRRQLLIIVLLTLSLPWAGCQYARHIEDALRATQIDNLKVLATTAVAQITPQLPPTIGDPIAMYAFALSSAPILDGYGDEWQQYQSTNGSHRLSAGETATGSNTEIIAGVHAASLYLFVTVRDQDIVYFNPTLRGANGDRLLLRLGKDAPSTRESLLSTSAPGKISTNTMQKYGVQAYLQENDGGYQIELRIPVNTLRQQNDPDAAAYLQITLYNTDTGAEHQQSLVSGRVFLPDKRLNNLLAFYADHTRRIQLLDRQGWILASSGSLHADAYADDMPLEESAAGHEWQQLWHSIRQQLYRWMLSDADTVRSAYPDLSSGKYQTDVLPAVLQGETRGVWRHHHLGQASTMVAVPVFTAAATSDANGGNHSTNSKGSGGPVRGAIIIEQANDAILSTSNAAISTLFNVSFTSIALITTALLLFASLLSWRIKRLSSAASAIINSDGEFKPQVHHSRVNDEIGELYRSFTTLQQRIQAYTTYLKSLAAKLSHELRTPLAMVSTSLENLQQTQTLNKEAQVYTQRANDGIHRLRQLVNAMSAATHVEQSISTAEKEHFDLAALLKNLTDAYGNLEHDKTLLVTISESPLEFYGAPELIAQLIDKLWDNALEFTPAKGKIYFELSANRQELTLRISNDGPLLPEVMHKQLFDSLVSIREHKSEQAHLGLGLHIAKLIAEFHHGSIRAFNRDDKSGAVFQLTLPR